MSRPLSPIERMIDAACGVSPARPMGRLTVKLECPTCGRSITTHTDKSDPPGTAKVRAVCDRCPDEAAVIDYFNEQGEQIDDEGSVMQHVSHRHSDEIAQLNWEVAMLREALLGLNNALDAMWNDPLPMAKALEKHAETITDWQQKAKKALTQEARKDA